MGDHVAEAGGQDVDAVAQRMFNKRGRRFLGDGGYISLFFGKYAASQLEMMEGLPASHPRGTDGNELRLRFWRYITGELSLRIEFGAAFGGGDALYAARMGQFLTIRCKPALAVRGCANACCRYADKQH